MVLILQGIQIAVLGGDDRELVLIPELIKMGAKVKVAGFPPCSELSEAHIAETVEEAIVDVQAIIMPMPGTDESGNIRAVYSPHNLKLTDKIVRQIAPYTPVLIGVARSFLKEWAARYRFNLIEMADMDQVAILNSIPSAEGAIQIAMESLPITIHGSQSWVLGFGRVGKTLARMLNGIGAMTTVCARNPADLARIWEMGYREVSFKQMMEKIAEADIIFNTVPVMALDRSVLIRCKREVLILDLASTPGGTDFEAAAELGIKAILAPGLPGKVAPRTAGKILAQVIPRLILEALNQKQEKEAVSGAVG
ncbi:MAG: dipicolinate synthase subunit DpsA [Syntrophomonadaceae bacterium]|nr:dipicolinate synthase subunit DpsA [Syntrophomonadaceae bacterium]